MQLSYALFICYCLVNGRAHVSHDVSTHPNLPVRLSQASGGVANLCGTRVWHTARPMKCWFTADALHLTDTAAGRDAALTRDTRFRHCPRHQFVGSRYGDPQESWGL
ncbi:hypothetical protein NDU88_006241 [Pleurodeles waltl]|uniref:Secreted protein n=1 Tax=Pleurodeles waltl TaxID=8319 RepID=A0AAV7TW88_PLEWA|nr:hypothetical protein NDU88_006241 [Pleurodeles waltl]